MKNTKNTLSLDLDLEDDRWEGIALLMFHSVTPSYAFVDDLNHLYDLGMARIEDLVIEGVQWPLFTHNDPLRQLRYYLVERPTAAATSAPFWTPGHKLMILIGQLAGQTAESIHNEFTLSGRPDDPDDIIAARHAELLDDLRSNFTTTTLLDPTAPPPPSLRGKALRDYNALFDIADTILETLDVKYISDI